MAERAASVLVIDDEKPVLEVLRLLLSKAGYQVKVAQNGAAALQIVHADAPPDVIILDLMMPVMSGFEVLAAIRTHPSWSAIPVIVLTATMGYSAGHLQADAVLVKPFDLETVKAAVASAIAAKRPSS